MRIQRRDDDDIRELLEHGSSWWAGPSPRASQSRWAARAEAGRRLRQVLGAARLVAVGAVFTAVVFGTTLVAASQSPRGAASTMMQLMSQVFPGATSSPGMPPDDSPPVSRPTSPAPRASGAMPARSPERPSPARSGEPEDRPASPWPAPASALPSPGPSRPPAR